MQQNRIAFNTANLVACFTDWRSELKNWGKQHEITVARMSTGEWSKACGQIQEAGFPAIEVWVAHTDPGIGQAGVRERKKIAADHGLEIIGLCAAATAANFDVCQWLGVDNMNGGLWHHRLHEAKAWSRASGVRFNYENHPEKSAMELIEKIEGGDDMTGLCVDTGWLGTQGIDAPAALRELGSLVRHVHLKDVRAAGGHHTTPLGEGVVDLEGCMQALREIGYAGWYSWEDEPEDRNPFDVAVQSREWIEARLR